MSREAQLRRPVVDSVSGSAAAKKDMVVSSLYGRIVLLGVLYAIALISSFFLAYEFRFDFAIEPRYWLNFKTHLAWIVPVKLVLLFFFGQFSGLLSYFSIPDLQRLFLANFSASSVLFLVWFQAGGPPRGVILTDFVFSVCALTATRLAFRLVRERFLSPVSGSSRHERRVGIVGAGQVGASLARDLLSKRGLGLRPVVFFDDDLSKQRSRLHDIVVLGPPERLLEPGLNLQLDEVIIAMPSAPAKRIGEIVKILQRTKLKFLTVPSMDQLALGKVKVSELRPVQIQDLLGRRPVQLETDTIRQLLSGTVVMVTGAGGSIGSELCRQIADFSPRQLLLVEQSEVQLFLIEQEMVERKSGSMIVPLVADIVDQERMRAIFARHQPDVVFHAAAHKHVPLMESQPGEAIKNNSLGTMMLAELAAEAKVGRFVLISTDKAINPTNVMGASKRLAEIFIQALHAAKDGGTKFMAVRFGNVLGSSGSVIPTFQKQIMAGGPVRVTHPEVTRYFMTIPEAVGLVLQSATQGTGGEIFVLDMGQPVKIVDLARQMIELSGLRPEEDIEIEFVGLRPGEKLFEELSHQGENIAPTNHPKIMRFVCRPADHAQVKAALAQMSMDITRLDADGIKSAIQRMVPEYTPFRN